MTNAAIALVAFALSHHFALAEQRLQLQKAKWPISLTGWLDSFRHKDEVPEEEHEIHVHHEDPEVNIGSGTVMRSQQVPLASSIVEAEGSVVESPVDCVWDDWREWSVCQHTCGQGNAVRTRQVRVWPSGGGAQCDGNLQEDRPCTGATCPIDCEWANWQLWSSCSATCGKADKTAYRNATPAQFGGRGCEGSNKKVAACELADCAVDCAWSPWGEWFACSKTCGEGKRNRFRTIAQTRNDNGAQCEGAGQDSVACSEEACPEDCQLEDWDAWTACSVTCGPGGSQTRSRAMVRHNVFGGASCGDLEETKTCVGDLKECGVDCLWTAWNDWRSCSSSCGPGSRNRWRAQAVPANQNGKPCAGEEKDQEPCDMGLCPVDCQASKWTEWGPCSMTCGSDGFTQRIRDISVRAANGGRACEAGEHTADTRKCSLTNCPVDCDWQDWQDWRGCSTTCGKGTSLRMRQVQTPEAYGGKVCADGMTQNRECFEKSCPQPCVWQQWTEWTACPVTCGLSNVTRHRKSTPEKYGGSPCLGEADEEAACHMGSCPVDCVWSHWSDWFCGASCGRGSSRRSRAVVVPAENGGLSCDGRASETRDCIDLPVCPVDCSWSDWHEWSNCSSSCGAGIKSRQRFRASFEAYGGQQCQGTEDAEAPCVMPDCPIDCGLSEWGSWASCPVTCGTKESGAERTRVRTIIGEAQNGGAPCSGFSLGDNKSCCIEPCPVDCVWAEWTDWETCSKSCGGGVSARTRYEQVPAVSGGLACEGAVKEEDVCKEQHCPVDCKWLSWNEWGSCSHSCGGGVRKQTRDTQWARFGGADCYGNESSTEVCNDQECPVDCEWTAWTPWQNCSKSCNVGVTSRSRSKAPIESSGGVPCAGLSNEQKTCNTQGCPRDCEWGPWSKWTECSKECDGGKTKRFRDVTQTMKNAGLPCLGSDEQELSCNSQKCPVDCAWSDWTVWSGCDVSCQGGSKVRTRRTITTDEFGGTPCSGGGTEIISCGLPACPVDCSLNPWTNWGECSVTCGAGQRYRTRSRSESRNGGRACEGNFIDQIDCVSEPSLDCPQDVTTTTGIATALRTVQQHWDPEVNRGTATDPSHATQQVSTTEPPQGDLPCSTDLEAALSKFNQTELENMRKDMTWFFSGRPVSAKVSGELILYVPNSDVFAENSVIRHALRKAVSVLTGADDEQVTIEVSQPPGTASLTEGQKQALGNLKVSYLIYCYKDLGKTAAEVESAISTHASREVAALVSQYLGSQWTVNAISMSLRVQRPMLPHEPKASI